MGYHMWCVYRDIYIKKSGERQRVWAWLYLSYLFFLYPLSLASATLPEVLLLIFFFASSSSSSSFASTLSSLSLCARDSDVAQVRPRPKPRKTVRRNRWPRVHRNSPHPPSLDLPTCTHAPWSRSHSLTPLHLHVLYRVYMYTQLYFFFYFIL